MFQRKMVVAITGASGSIYARDLLNQLQSLKRKQMLLSLSSAIMPAMFGPMN